MISSLLGQQLDIALADHLIISAGRWVSVQTWLKQAGTGDPRRTRRAMK
jgi:hypothetical protein